MFTLPYRTLIHQQRWATNGLHAVIAENIDRVPTDELPSLDALAKSARATADWYVDYADALKPEEVDEPIAFSFANGKPARMTRGEMLLHVAMHAAGHRGQAALLLQKNGIVPWPDRITDFVGSDADVATAEAEAA